MKFIDFVSVKKSNQNCNPHIPNIDALNSDTHTLFFSTILNSQCVGVAIEGIDIWYMGFICLRRNDDADSVYFQL